MQEGGAETPGTNEGNAQRNILADAVTEIEKAVLSSKKGSKRPSLVAEKGSRKASLDQEKGSRRSSLDPGKLSRRQSLSLGKEKKLSIPEREDKKQVSETVEDKGASSKKIESNTPKSVKDPKSASDDQESLADALDALVISKSKDGSVEEALAAELENQDVDLPNAQSKEDISAEPVEEIVLDEVPAQIQGGDENPILTEDQPTGQQAVRAKPGTETTKRQPCYVREACRIRQAEVMYKAAARVIQDPTKPLHQRLCAAYIPGTSVRGAQGGSNRQDTEAMRSVRCLFSFLKVCLCAHLFNVSLKPVAFENSG